MSELGDLIVNHGPFTEPLRFGGFGDQDEFTDHRHLDALRDELIELRAIVAKVETDQCGCLGGPLSIEWADPPAPPLGRKHPTCIDVTTIDQPPRSAWMCGPDCPKEA